MHRITVKIFVKDAAGIVAKSFVPLFHRWIQQKSIEGLLIDVADYSHVIDGPGVVLIGHEGDYGIDSIRGRTGLLHTRKRGFSAGADLKQQLRETLRSALLAAAQLEKDSAIRFNAGDIQIALQDRLAAPNTDAGFAAVRADIEAVLGELFDAKPKIERAFTDKREALTVNVTAPGAPALASLISRTEAGVTAR